MDQEDENLKMAIKMSLSPQEPKRSKPQDDLEGERGGESSEARSQRMRRELMAAAAERRMKEAAAAKSPSQPAVVKKAEKATSLPSAVAVGEKAAVGPSSGGVEGSGVVGEELSSKETEQLFSMIFGSDVSKDILAQWTNQGIRYFCNVGLRESHLFLSLFCRYELQNVNFVDSLLGDCSCQWVWLRVVVPSDEFLM